MSGQGHPMKTRVQTEEGKRLFCSWLLWASLLQVSFGVVSFSSHNWQGGFKRPVPLRVFHTRVKLDLQWHSDSALLPSTAPGPDSSARGSSDVSHEQPQGRRHSFSELHSLCLLAAKVQFSSLFNQKKMQMLLLDILSHYFNDLNLWYMRITKKCCSLVVFCF